MKIDKSDKNLKQISQKTKIITKTIITLSAEKIQRNKGTSKKM
jgi:hypothetical protein